MVELQRADTVPACAAVARAWSLRRRVLVTQFVFGLAYWWWLAALLVFAATWANQVDASAHATAATVGWIGTVFGLSLVVAPALLAAAVQAGWRRRLVWAGFGAWLALGAAGGLLVGGDWIETAAIVFAALLFWGTLAAFLGPTLRGAGPPLIAALVAGFTALLPVAMFAVAIDSADSDAWFTGWADLARDLALLGVGLAAAGWTARRMLARIARRYAEKRFSDQQLAFAAYWGLVTTYTLAIVLGGARRKRQRRTGRVGCWCSRSPLGCSGVGS